MVNRGEKPRVGGKVEEQENPNLKKLPCYVILMQLVSFVKLGHPLMLIGEDTIRYEYHGETC